jgi:hypothetical protein
MKLSHKLSIVAALVVVVIVGATIFLWSSLDKIIAGAIEQYGSEVTQTPVNVSGVKVGLTTGEGSISGLSIGNPKGFTDPNIFTLGNITTKIDTATVTEPTIVIKEILVGAPSVFYEIDKSGASNLDALNKNISAVTDGGKSSDGGDAPKLIINRLLIDGGKVSARIAALGDKSLSANLPRIELKDIGKSSGGATATEVSEKVVNALMEKSRTAVMNLGVDKYLGKSLDEVKSQLGSKVQDALNENTGSGVEDTLKKGGDAVKGLFGN